jgi:hypothetical protein
MAPVHIGDLMEKFAACFGDFSGWMRSKRLQLNMNCRQCLCGERLLAGSITNPRPGQFRSRFSSSDAFYVGPLSRDFYRHEPGDADTRSTDGVAKFCHAMSAALHPPIDSEVYSIRCHEVSLVLSLVSYGYAAYATLIDLPAYLHAAPDGFGTFICQAYLRSPSV